MAITLDYSPIATALGLAAQAGQGQRRRQQQQVDLQTIGLANDMQRASDQRQAQEIQQSLEEQRLGVNAQEAASRAHDSDVQQAALQAYRTQDLAQQKQYHDAQLEQQKQNADNLSQYRTTGQGIQQQNADLAGTKFQTQQNAIDQLPADQQNIVRAQGHLPPAGQDEMRLLSAEYRRLNEALRQAVKDQQAAAYDETDRKKILAEPSSSNPQAIKGMEAAYDAAGKRATAIQQRMQAIDDQLNGRTSSVLQPGAPAAVAPQAINQIVQHNEQAPQQSAPDQQPRILATERNPQDGKMWGYDANQGRWIPLE